MRLFRLEVKRIIKSRRTLALFAAALFMSVVMAYLPVSFESINRLGEDGKIIELDGLSAIRFKRDYYEKTAGDITPGKLAEALRTYQSYVKEYGTLNDVPLDIYIENIMAIRPMLKGLTEAFADPKTGAAADLMDIDPVGVEQHFYEKCVSHLDDIMDLEQKEYESAGQFAADKYADADQPFYLYPGMSRDAFDYTTLYILVLSILCVAIAAPIFANEYQTGSDSILRCTKYGRMKLAVTRILAACCIFIIIFILGMSIHLLILNLAFGTDCLKTSFQMLFSIINLPNINLGQLQIILVFAGLLSLLATISCTLFLSARCRDSLTVLLISIVVLFLPIFAHSAFAGASWISTVLPSAGIGMQNNFLYQLYNFNFLHIGEASFWTPYVILISAAVEIPVFLFLAVRSYCKHQVA
ncbi:ABC transporter permease [Schaedlerella arabinosiphila]|jgi:ABC-type transport system involved in multi-copper enzyme maturation permease subunit|uniref:ABC transporter permease n=1 Tax=Schaedlerella arabinosiphila TaxID=2044587 RepID=A0A3R8L3H3_9FIRM|nr:ABC transporter permease subunit [Schaedlerella arabinosiphila]RRK36977.1 ABC transporter permease [Schaedlerella arabinosiphila]